MRRFQSYRHAQIPAECQYCTNTRSIRWKCLDCNIIFCDNCKINIHSTIKLSEHHHILDTTNPTGNASDVYRRADLQAIPCEIHSDKFCTFYCRNLDKLVCDKCPLTLHKQSTLCNIERVCEEKLADIMNFKDKIDNEISFYSEKRKYLKKTKSDGYENIDKTKQEIVKREELLCDLVTTQTQTMTIDLDDELKQKLGTITKLKEKTQNRRQKIGKSIMKIDTLLQSNKVTTLFYALREIGGKSYSPVKINTNDLVKAFRNYCFKCLSKLNVLKLFGITREIKSMETSNIFNLGILRIYTKNHK